jgi:hypothetical protein
MATKNMNYIALFIGLVFALLFAVALRYLAILWQSNRAGTWPTAPGRIEHSRLIETVDSDNASSYEAHVRYAYTVMGTPYTGTRIAIGYACSGFRDTHAEIVKRLPAGAPVAVRYDPSDPASAVLSYGTHLSHKRALAFVGFWLVALIALTVIGWLSFQRDTVLLDNLGS